MKRLGYFLTPYELLQSSCATALLWTSPQWHWMQCQGVLYEMPLWALMGFSAWRTLSGFHLLPAVPAAPPPHNARVVQQAVCA